MWITRLCLWHSSQNLDGRKIHALQSSADSFRTNSNSIVLTSRFLVPQVIMSCHGLRPMPRALLALHVCGPSTAGCIELALILLLPQLMRPRRLRITSICLLRKRATTNTARKPLAAFAAQRSLTRPLATEPTPNTWYFSAEVSDHG
jgi:hypothetical protein